MFIKKMDRSILFVKFLFLLIFCSVQIVSGYEVCSTRGLGTVCYDGECCYLNATWYCLKKNYALDNWWLMSWKTCREYQRDERRNNPRTTRKQVDTTTTAERTHTTPRIDNDNRTQFYFRTIQSTEKRKPTTKRMYTYYRYQRSGYYTYVYSGGHVSSSKAVKGIIWGVSITCSILFIGCISCCRFITRRGQTQRMTSYLRPITLTDSARQPSHIHGHTVNNGTYNGIVLTYTTTQEGETGNGMDEGVITEAPESSIENKTEETAEANGSIMLMNETNDTEPNLNVPPPSYDEVTTVHTV